MEIERKWMVNGWPEGLPLKEEFAMRQGYISVRPTVRIREEALTGGKTHYVLCFIEQLRLFFESSLVRYAAEHATDEQIDLLAKALEINSQSLDNNAAFIRSDVDFHRVLAEIPGNPIFMAIHVALLDWLIAARPTVTDQALHEHNNVSYQQHIAIVDAIRRHDPDEADRALQSHLNSVSATWHAFGQTTNKKK